MIEIYSKTTCPFCHLAKTYLQEHNIPYQEYLYDDDAARQDMYDRFDLVGRERTVPQIFLLQGGLKERIGGYRELVNADLVSRIQVETFNADF